MRHMPQPVQQTTSTTTFHLCDQRSRWPPLPDPGTRIVRAQRPIGAELDHMTAQVRKGEEAGKCFCTKCSYRKLREMLEI